MDLQLFLDSYRTIKQSNMPTYIQIAGYPRWENVWSNILAFYLGDNPHRMKGFLLDCLARLISENLGDVEKVEREVYTENRNRIDIFVETDLACIVIENKVDALLTNDLADYLNYCIARCVGRKSIGIVLSKNKEEVPKPYHNITYKELIGIIESRISEVILTSDQRYFSYFLDFVATVKQVMEGAMELNKDFFTLYKKDRDKILNIVSNYNSILQFNARMANDYVAIFSSWPIKYKEKIWVWEKNTTVIDMKELNKNLKIVFDLSFTADGVRLSLHNRYKKSNDKEMIGSICAEIKEKMTFIDGRYYSNLIVDLDKLERVKEYLEFIEIVIDNYEKLFT